MFLIFASSSHLLVAAVGAVHLECAGSVLYAGTTEGDKMFGRRVDSRRVGETRKAVEDGGQRRRISDRLH